MAIQPVSPYVAPTTAPVTPATAASRDAQSTTGTAKADAPKTSETPASAQPSREQIDEAMVEVKKALAPVARNLQFSIDDATGRSVVKVIDASTNEVIRQFPSEELLAITRGIDRFSGLLVKNKA